MTSALRALVVDDDAAYRRVIDQSLRRIGISEITSAGDLAIARSKIERGSFDVVTVDVVLRGESGLDLLAWLRAEHPDVVPVLVTSGSAANACTAVDALILGAAALILKPSGPCAADQLDRALSGVLRGIAKRRAAPDPSRASQAIPVARLAGKRTPVAAARELIAIGASTGGPPAVLELLERLKPGLHTPIVIAQHMPALHMPHYAEQLAVRTGIAVTVADHGEVVVPGHVYVSPGGRHLVVTREAGKVTLRHDDGPEEHHCKPAVDPLFRSVARTCGAAAIGVILTGMGSDGALGAELLSACGVPIAAQDRATSVVWGMPGAVATRGAADLIAPIPEIAQWVLSLDTNSRNRRTT